MAQCIDNGLISNYKERMKSQFIIHLMAKIHDQTNKFLINELRNYGIEGIAPSHGDVIGALCLNDKMTMKDLAVCINRDKSTVTALVNKLVNMGYIEKKANPADNRVTWVCLSAKGKRIKPAILDISKKMHDKAYQHISPEELNALSATLLKIHRNF